jgi:hypothetical protein
MSVNADQGSFNSAFDNIAQGFVEHFYSVLCNQPADRLKLLFHGERSVVSIDGKVGWVAASSALLEARSTVVSGGGGSFGLVGSVNAVPLRDGGILIVARGRFSHVYDDSVFTDVFILSPEGSSFFITSYISVKS